MHLRNKCFRQLSTAYHRRLATSFRTLASALDKFPNWSEAASSWFSNQRIGRPLIVDRRLLLFPLAEVFFAFRLQADLARTSVTTLRQNS